MRPLSQSDCRALSSALEAIYGINSVAAFPAGVLSAVRNLVRCNTACFNEMASPSSMITWVAEPADALPRAALKEAFMRNLADHPVLLHYAQTRDGASYRISDFLSLRQFHRLPLYCEYYRPSSVEYQLVAAISTGPRSIGLALDRDVTDFSEDERVSLELLRPHLLQAFRNVQTLGLMRRAIEDSGRKLLVVTRSRPIESVTDDVWRVIDKYFETPRLHTSLPDVLKRWMAYEMSRFGSESEPPRPSSPLEVRKGSQKLVVRFLWGGKTADHDALLIEEEASQHLDQTIADPGLTRRENEVLSRLAKGETNAEIALALSVSPLTVKKHLEHIYGKLHVDRRGAAVARTYHL